MNRRTFAIGMGAIVAAPLAAAAQPTGHIYRLGILESSALWEPFHQRLRELGYVEGRNLIVEKRSVTEGKPEQIAVMAQQLVKIKVEVIATAGAVATSAAMRATTTIPIVMIAVGDPVGIGLVQSLARPGGNVTESSVLGPETSMKRLELLKEFMPRLTKFSLLWNASNPANVIYERDTGSAARALHVTMHSVPVTDPGQLEQAFATIEHERPNAMIVSGDLILQPTWNGSSTSLAARTSP